MAFRNEHLVVIMLEPMPAGQEFEIWPLHITIVPWFPVDDEVKLENVLKNVAAKHQRFTVQAGRRQQWGRKEKFDVVPIEDSYKLHSLHWNVFHNLEKNGFPVHQKDFLGEKYRPHFVIRNEIQKNQDQPKTGVDIKISSFWLVSQVRLKKSGRMIKKLEREYTLPS